ncbi:hypothetical protein [Pseudomonas sp. WS 5410]|uniref:hypothetical protein n=1 Tax=Pseudomonas sp. WS 5410 TaxID=2717485 RepID=UPI00147544DE|nr:hypothetical protein [Pseudomonas sp. WS 5410]
MQLPNKAFASEQSALARFLPCHLLGLTSWQRHLVFAQNLREKQHLSCDSMDIDESSCAP